MAVKVLKKLFKIDKKPIRGLLAVEWIMVAYMMVTLALMLVTYTKLHNPESMLIGRMRIAATVAALWLVYRMIPCRLTLLFRVVAQMAMLSWWYPDTYEFNRIFPNLDHIFASWDQWLFGFQPSQLFCLYFGHPMFSELMDLGYTSYYPLIAAVIVYFFGWRYEQFGRASFIVIGSFFVYYLIYIAFPVAGPQFYYKAVGMAEIARGVFPNVGDYFATHQEALASPGWHDGLFYQMVVDAHNAGERPTAAFPSSHVGVSTIIMMIVWTTRNRRFFIVLLPFYVLLCLSTVYIYAHYAVDVIGGWMSAIIIYAILWFTYNRLVKHHVFSF